MSTSYPRRRPLVPAALLLLAAMSFAHADAAIRKPKPLCNLVTDAVDLSGSPSLDIVSADIATNNTTLTWVVRVVNLGSDADRKTTLGRSWSFVYKVGDRQITNKVLDGPFGPRDGSANGATVKLDKDKNEVRYTAPLEAINSAYGIKVVPGTTVFKELTASTADMVQLPAEANYNQPLPDGDNSDTSLKTYPAGTSSCVTVG